MNWLVAGLLACITAGGIAQDSLNLTLMDKVVTVLYQGTPHSPVLMYNMHDNENTSATAGRVISRKYGGEYFELRHDGNRLISFTYQDDTIRIDPNRIYTDAGIWQQLKRNKITDTLVFKAIAAWRDKLLLFMDIQHRELVIALHNNTNQNYSVKSYLPGEEYEKEAANVYRGMLNDKDDFYFVTDPYIMDRLACGKYSVILQANQTMTDDGSLSVYCAQKGIAYINVEAQHNRLVRQIKMLLFAFQQLVHKE